MPFLRQFKDDVVIRSIVSLLKPKYYEAGSKIVGFGQRIEDIHFVRAGAVRVEVPEIP